MPGQVKAQAIPRPGTMIVVVGPSGAGKDSVIDFALRRLGRDVSLHLVQRAITRPTDAGGEDHECVSPEAFDARLYADGFAVAWEAHGLKYGIPRDTVERIGAGQTLIANGSRAALAQFRLVFPRLVIVQIVASAEVLAQRLVARGRESEANIRLRLARQAPEIVDKDVVVIDNSGPLEIAGTQFADLVAALAFGVTVKSG
ncbi:phosphonate metabolism protein/1,5-bisphosphokinase (PRPP-forming) PhnN [Rhizobium sp. 32-5/1]|uniref:phosphonate metabolism protein/1,5-bisphosphokinase (PRPP-forming) PhnN n=1 Tax=Rhizobium sp. 32-5/1 TaxID=3019602 RepID=UPI00240DA9A3|nr:phosphonate metabolism protein/1,5-bisphosphokinase (PRPP-forming) PhnN [Rhizobium sp. 32-5/1]WEZ82025.1 phosphonate metabolism protein/1,5-bisphosphokinase (PRPP-forming) PhnN [Rhizobium sp. 32-5/1]